MLGCAFVLRFLIQIEWLHVGAVDRRMATRRPAGADADKPGMIHIADVEVPRRNRGTGCLRMATQTEIGIAHRKHLGINGAVRVVASGATFA